MHAENLATILTGFNSGEAQDRLDEQLRYFAEGEIGHASEAFSSLWRTLIQGRGRKTTCDTRLNTVHLSTLRVIDSNIYKRSWKPLLQRNLHHLVWL